MSLCLRCLRLGFCVQNRALLISDDELDNPVFRCHIHETVRAMRIADHKWHEHVSNLYRDFQGVIVDARGRAVLLDMEVFEIASIREWFRDWLYGRESGHAPRLRAESRERVRILGTLIRAHFPEKASLWGKVAANDN